MSKIKVITESASDIRPQDAKEWDIEVLPFTIHADGKEYLSGVDLQPKEFYELLKNSKEVPQTSQIPPNAIYDAFKKYTDEGYEILYVSISSSATGTYNNAMLAKNMVLEENPDAVIELVDTRRFAYIYAWAAIEAAKLAKEGKSIDELKKAVMDFVESYDVYVVAQTLTYLEKGGRINKASLVMGNVLDIRPLLSVRNGLMESIGSIRGSKKIVAKLFKKVQESGYDQTGKRMLIVHADMYDEAEEIKAMIEENMSPSEVLIREVGPTIATHIGPVLGVFFAIK